MLQVQRTASGDTLATARPDDLVQILDGLQRREDDLNVEIAELQDTLGRLQRSGASSRGGAGRGAAAGRGAGHPDRHRAGDRARASPSRSHDPDRRIPPEVMLDAIQELRNAGAEAFQVGAVRIGVDSAFTGSGGAITLDGTALTAPVHDHRDRRSTDAGGRAGHPGRGVRHRAPGGRDDGRRRSPTTRGRSTPCDRPRRRRSTLAQPQ